MAPPNASAHRLSGRAHDIEPFRVVEVMERAWAIERAEGADVIRLCVGEPDFGTPAPVVEAAARSAQHGQVHYSSALGLPPLREAIAGYYRERFGLDLPAARVVVTTGASGALLLAVAATVDRDEAVLLADPGYPCNRSFVRLFEARPVGLPVGPGTGYQPTAEQVAAAWDDRTRGVLLASPANPTGTLVTGDELARIVEVAGSLGGTAFVDEIYGELVYDRKPTTVLARRDDVFVVNSFSKTFGMTGWRLGWLVAPDWALGALERLAQNLYIAPPTPAQWGAVAAFSAEVWAEVDERRRAFRERRDLLVAGLRALGFVVPVLPEGAFYVYADCSPFGTAGEVCERLLVEAGVAVTPGHDFGRHGADRHIRFSYTTSLPRIAEALERMGRVLG